MKNVLLIVLRTICDTGFYIACSFTGTWLALTYFNVI